MAAWLEARRWRILATGVQVGRDELDIIGIEPGTPPCLVFVEVRSHTNSRFGSPEESVSAAKLARTYRAAFALLRLAQLPDGTPFSEVVETYTAGVLAFQAPGP